MKEQTVIVVIDRLYSTVIVKFNLSHQKQNYCSQQNLIRRALVGLKGVQLVFRV